MRRIVDRVRDGGDPELVACVRKFDGAGVENLEVTREEWDLAAESIDPADRAALGKAGNAGGVLFLSQSVVSSQSRTNCLSNDGGPEPPGCTGRRARTANCRA